mmetsp:Transcript_95627/g.276288  ORF Transcript_95627/g.276288 Transcript_95627/m.276288 type:complete len:205 (-) Transcript_95627:881-1495(-)
MRLQTPIAAPPGRRATTPIHRQLQRPFCSRTLRSSNTTVPSPRNASCRWPPMMEDLLGPPRRCTTRTRAPSSISQTSGMPLMPMDAFRRSMGAHRSRKTTVAFEAALHLVGASPSSPCRIRCRKSRSPPRNRILRSCAPIYFLSKIAMSSRKHPTPWHPPRCSGRGSLSHRARRSCCSLTGQTRCPRRPRRGSPGCICRTTWIG